MKWLVFISIDRLGIYTNHHFHLGKPALGLEELHSSWVRGKIIEPAKPFFNRPCECYLRLRDLSSDPWSQRRDRIAAMTVRMTVSTGAAEEQTWDRNYSKNLTNILWSPEVETSGMQPPAPVRNARRMKPEAASPTPSGSSTQSSNKTKKTVTKRPPPKKPSRRKAPAKKRANKATSSANSVSRSLPHRPHQQERKALMVQFEELKAHTAKCDDCDNRNSEGMSRCKLCGWQCCRRCQAIRGGDKTHETVRGPHIPIGESPGAQITTSLVGTAGRLATAGRALSAFAADERMPPAAHMVADRTPTAAEQDAVRALMRMSSSPPAQIIGEFNAESPVSPSTSRSVSADDDHNRTLEDFSDVETVGGDSTITWHSSLDENDEQLESILEPLGLCRRNPPRASRPADMRD